MYAGRKSDLKNSFKTKFKSSISMRSSFSELEKFRGNNDL